MGKKVFTNIVWMLTTGVSCALGAAVYSVISWRSVLFVEETDGSGENHRPYASHWQTLSHNVVSSTHRLSVKWQEFLLWDNYILTFNILHSEFLQMECGIRQTLTRWLYMYITNYHLKSFHDRQRRNVGRYHGVLRNRKTKDTQYNEQKENAQPLPPPPPPQQKKNKNKTRIHWSLHLRIG